MMPLSWVGKTIGERYQIEALLGQGGMSAVYRASDPNLRRLVAIKLIHTHLSTDPNFIGRFKEEAAAVARLRHPNIVQVHDFNVDGETYYMVMEYLVGETLQARLKRLNANGRCMPIDESLRLCIQVCEAAGYAHNHELVHRDIKPANIMLNVDGQAILMDFGIVKIIGGDYHTATGATIGTAVYMSPEQIRSQRIDDRADIYSLGVTLFEMLSGRPPYMADSALTLMMMVLNDPLPDLSEARTGIPESLELLVKKALAKDPAKRFQTMSEMAAALQQVREELLSSPLEPAPTLVDESETEAASPIPQPATVIDSSLDFGIAQPPTASPPEIVSSANIPQEREGTPPDLAIKGEPVKAAPAQPAAPVEPHRLVRGNTRRILLITSAVLFLIAAVAAVLYYLNDTKPPSALLASINQPSIPLNPQVAQSIVNLGSWETDSYIEEIAYSPDSSLLATANNRDYVRFSTYRFYTGLWDIHVGALENTLFGPTQWVFDLAFSPDGELIASASDDGGLFLWQINNAELVRKIESPHGGLTSLAFSPNNLLLAAGAWNGTVSLWQINNGNLLRTLEAGEYGVLDIAFSPDGALLAASSEDHSILLWQISDGRQVYNLEDHTAPVSELAFSPDGSLLASASEDHTVKIWQVDDGALLHTLESHSETVYDVAFSVDGSMLASGSADGTLRLWQVSDGTLLSTVTEYWDGIKSVAFSPDGFLLVSAAANGVVQFWGISDAIPTNNQ